MVLGQTGKTVKMNAFVGDGGICSILSFNMPLKGPMSCKIHLFISEFIYIYICGLIDR